MEGILVTCWLRYRVFCIVIFAACEDFVYWVSEVMALSDIILNFLMGERLPLPPGIRFHPTDVELVLYYLKKKVMGKRLRFEAIPEVDIYKFSPWDLPGKSILGSGDLKWYFFCPLEKKYSSGARMNRATECGFWKVTGKDRLVHHNEELVGSIKTLIFHNGRAPGERTDWVLYEYRLEDKNLAESVVQNNKYVLCAIFQKEGVGPRNGAQYGAPFKEEDWNDDEEVRGVESGPSAGLSTPAFMLPSNCNSSVAAGTSQLGGTFSESCLSETMPSHCEGLPAVRANNVVLKESGDDGDILSTVLGNNVVSKELDQVLGDDDIPSMINYTLISNEDDKYKNPSNDGNDIDDGLDIFQDLEDLPDVDHYLDLTDLDKPLNDSSVLPP